MGFRGIAPVNDLGDSPGDELKCEITVQFLTFPV